MSACKNSRIGARIACEISGEILLDHVDYYFESSSEKAKSLILMNIRNAIEQQAKNDGCSIEDYASTLCFVCFDKRLHRVIMFSLGDSRIYQIQNDEIRYINRTVSHGENVICSTVSSSAKREAILNCKSSEENEAFLLCTDGMWKTAEERGLLSDPMGWEDPKRVIDFFEQYPTNDDCSFLLAA